jgi:chromosome segregation ATPase
LNVRKRIRSEINQLETKIQEKQLKKQEIQRAIYEAGKQEQKQIFRIEQLERERKKLMHRIETLEKNTQKQENVVHNFNEILKDALLNTANITVPVDLCQAEAGRTDAINSQFSKTLDCVVEQISVMDRELTKYRDSQGEKALQQKTAELRHMTSEKQAVETRLNTILNAIEQNTINLKSLMAESVHLMNHTAELSEEPDRNHAPEERLDRTVRRLQDGVRYLNKVLLLKESETEELTRDLKATWGKTEIFRQAMKTAATALNHAMGS